MDTDLDAKVIATAERLAKLLALNLGTLRQQAREARSYADILSDKHPGMPLTEWAAGKAHGLECALLMFGESIPDQS